MIVSARGDVTAAVGVPGTAFDLQTCLNGAVAAAVGCTNLSTHCLN
jgi:hypothetical protein